MLESELQVRDTRVIQAIQILERLILTLFQMAQLYINTSLLFVMPSESFVDAYS